jgi:hypothetical protein
VISGPNTVTNTGVAKEIGGSISKTAGVAVNYATDCLTDTFTLTGPTGSVPPVLCGTNTGQHGKKIVR